MSWRTPVTMSWRTPVTMSWRTPVTMSIVSAAPNLSSNSFASSGSFTTMTRFALLNASDVRGTKSRASSSVITPCSSISPTVFSSINPTRSNASNALFSRRPLFPPPLRHPSKRWSVLSPGHAHFISPSPNPPRCRYVSSIPYSARPSEPISGAYSRISSYHASNFPLIFPAITPARDFFFIISILLRPLEAKFAGYNAEYDRVQRQGKYTACRLPASPPYRISLPLLRRNYPVQHPL